MFFKSLRVNSLKYNIKLNFKRHPTDKVSYTYVYDRSKGACMTKNKGLILLTLATMAVSGKSWSASCSASGSLDQNPCASAPDMLAVPGERDGSSYKGTDFFLACQGMSTVSWEQMNSASGSHWEGKWKYTYSEVYDEHLKSAYEELQRVVGDGSQAAATNQSTAPAADGTTAAPAAVDPAAKRNEVLNASKKLATAYNAAYAALGKAREEIIKCQGMIGLTSRLREGDYQEAKSWSPSTTKTSLDGQIKCVAMGAETQDYLPCTTAINAYDGLFVADQGVQVYQQVSYVDKSMDIQQKLAEDSTNVTAGLEAQKSNLETQADMANQKAVFDGAKAAALAAAAGSMPSLESLVSECQGNLSNGLSQINTDFNTIAQHLTTNAQNFAQIVAQYEVQIQIEPRTFSMQALKEVTGLNGATHNSGDQAGTLVIAAFNIDPNSSSNKSENICNNVAGTEAQALIMNDDARQKMKAAMVAAGIDAAGNLAKAAILNKHADRIADAMKDVESFAPPEFTGPAFEDGMFSECSADPESEACAIEAANQRVDFSGNNISISGFERGVVGGTTDEGTAAMNELDKTNPTSRSGSTAPNIGSAIDAVDKSGGLEDTASKASVNTNTSGNGGGGGGGGAGSIAPPSGGGAQPVGEQAANNGTGIAGNTSKMSFSGGTGRATSLAGGTRAAMARKETKVDNPFDKLFGKKGAGGNELSFRNPAAIGKGKGSVLEQISRRYGEISKSDRLLKYEEKDAK